MDERLFNDQAAIRAGLKPATWRRYCTARPGKRRLGPKPDGTVNDRGHARPWWRPSTVDRWLANRPGQGARTDLSKTGRR